MNSSIDSRPVIEFQGVSIYYKDKQVLRPLDAVFYPYQVTAIIGSSGTGKSTLLRAVNRMNECIDGCTTVGKVLYKGVDIYGADVDPVEVRKMIGMVFQKPNPFPKSIYENVAYGPRIRGAKRGELDRIVEDSLRKAALWGEVKDQLHKSAYDISGGQQQRLVIARALAVNPDVILMDEPCASLDPIATGKIEDLLRELKQETTIILVTHNIEQARRIADWVVFMNKEVEDKGGYLHLFGRAPEVFINPKDPVFENYITVRFNGVDGKH